MNQCVSYFIGFLMGAAVIKVLGLVARGRWLVFVLAVSSPTVFAYVGVKAVNTGGGTVYFNCYRAANANTGAAAFAGPSGSLAPGGNQQGDCYSANITLATWNSWGPPLMSYYTYANGTDQAAAVTAGNPSLGATGGGTFTVCQYSAGYSCTVDISGAAPLYTNSVVNECFTVTWPGNYTVNWLADGSPLLDGGGQIVTKEFPNAGVGDVLCFTNNLTDGRHLSWYLTGPGGADTDFLFKTWIDGDGVDTSTPGTNPGNGTSSGGQTDNDSVDADTTPRTPNSGTATDPRIPDRENAEAIVKAVDRARNEISATVRIGSNAITNAIDHASTNNTGGAGTNDYTALLQQIATNTLNTADRMTALTNQMDSAFGISTNIGAFSNLVVGGISMSVASNFFNSSAIAGVIDDAISGVKSSATNASTAFTLTGNPLEFSIAKTAGGYAHLNVGLVSTANDSPTISGIRAKLYTLLNWIRSWFLKLIPWVMFWAVMWSALKWQEEIQMCFVHNLPTVSGNVSLVGLLSKTISIQLAVKAATTLRPAKPPATVPEDSCPCAAPCGGCQRKPSRSTSTSRPPTTPESRLAKMKTRRLRWGTPNHCESSTRHSM